MVAASVSCSAARAVFSARRSSAPRPRPPRPAGPRARSPGRRRSRAPARATPPTHMNCCSSSTTVTGTNATLLASHRPCARRASPFDEKVSAERGTRIGGRRRERDRHLGGDAVRDVAVRIGDLDVDPIGARRRARGLRDEADLALRRVAGDEADFGRIAELEAVQLALGDLDDREDRIERDDLRDLLAGHRERRLPDLDRHLVDTPDQGARTTPRSRSASAAASAASAALYCASQLPCSSRGSVPCATSFIFASSSALRCVSMARACATCDSRASSDRMAMTSPCLTNWPRRTFSSDTTPEARAVTIILRSASVRPESTSLRLRGSTSAGTTATRNAFASRSGGADRGLALGRLVRKQVTGRDPGARRDDEADGGKASRFHDTSPVPLSVPAQGSTSNCSTMPSTIGITPSALNDGSTARRHDSPSASANRTVTVPSKSMSRRTSPRSAALRSNAMKLLADVRLHVLVDARDGRIAAALRHDLGTERNLLHAALDQMVLRQRGEALEEVALADRRELLRGLGALALRDAGDDVFLGAEVAVEVARAHAGLRRRSPASRSGGTRTAQSRSAPPRGFRRGGRPATGRWPGA